MLRAGLAGLAGSFLGACGGTSDDGKPAAPGTQSRLAKVVLENQGSQEAQFNLKLDGRSFFCNDDDVLRAVGVTRTGANDLEFALALWRFVIDNRYHHEPYSPRHWAHAPTTFFNSIGFGLCDDAASLFRALATRAGLESRVWFLNGHLVSEARIGGRWVVFDADLEAYYLDRSGQLAGVEQLSADPTLVSSPQAPMPCSAMLRKALEGLVPGLDDGIAPAYLPFIADLYASAADNWVEPWYDYIPLLSFAPAPITLPPGARLIISSSDTTPVTSYNDVPAPLSATMRVELAAGWSGTLGFPLIIAAAHGAGRVRIGGEVKGLDSEAFAQYFAARAEPLTSLEFVGTEQGDALTLLVNASRFQLADLREVSTVAASAETSLTLSQRVTTRP